jgi:hypothetical protein
MLDTFSNEGAQTSWGSREDGDTNDDKRMAPPPQQSIVLKTPPGTTSLVRYNIRQKGRQTLREVKGGEQEKEKHYAAYDSGTSYIPHRILEKP